MQYSVISVESDGGGGDWKNGGGSGSSHELLESLVLVAKGVLASVRGDGNGGGHENSSNSGSSGKSLVLVEKGVKHTVAPSHHLVHWHGRHPSITKGVGIAKYHKKNIQLVRIKHQNKKKDILFVIWCTDIADTPHTQGPSPEMPRLFSHTCIWGNDMVWSHMDHTAFHILGAGWERWSKVVC